MEEKVALKRELNSAKIEANTVIETINKKIRERDGLTQESANAVAKAKTAAEQEFRKATQAKKDTVSRVVKQVRSRAESTIDSLPKKEAAEYAGKYEIKEVEKALMEHYPQAFIEDYVAYDPISFKDDADILQHFEYCEAASANMLSGFNVASAYTLISTMLQKILEEGDRRSIGGALAAIGLLIVGSILNPSIILCLFSCVGAIAVASGVINKKLFRNLYSIKLQMNHSFDEDKFERDKKSVMNSVDDFLMGVEQDYLEQICEEQFKWDPDREKSIKDGYNARSKQLTQDIEELHRKRRMLSDRIESLERKLGELDAAARKAAESAKEIYLNGIDWKKEWPENIYLGNEGSSTIRLHPVIQGNVLYYAHDVEPLQNFMKLFAYQILLKVHPDYLYQIFIDYRYMGGSMQQFLALPPRCFSSCLSGETIGQKLDFIRNDMMARTTNILQTASGIEEFNEIMAKYNSPGELMCIVHIFGLTQFNEAYQYMLRNGAKVGYYFNIYLTMDELTQISDDKFIEFFNDIYEVDEFTERRSSAVVKAILHPNS